MSLRTTSVWVLAGLAVVSIMFIGGGVAKAGTIGLKGNISPLPGDPPFLYTFELDLNDFDDGPITPGATLTVGTPPTTPGGMVTNGLIGVTGQSGTQEPPTTGVGGGNSTDIWFVPLGGIITSNTGNPAPFNQESSVTWQFASGDNYQQLGLVGFFTVETTSDFPDNMPPVTPGVTIVDFSFKFANGDISSGSITLTFVPEPSSVILLLAGVGALPLLHRFLKRSRPSRVA